MAQTTKENVGNKFASKNILFISNDIPGFPLVLGKSEVVLKFPKILFLKCPKILVKINKEKCSHCLSI